MLRAAFVDTLGNPDDRRYIATIMADVEPATLTGLTGSDVIGMQDGDIIAVGSQIISPTSNYLAFEDGNFKQKS